MQFSNLLNRLRSAVTLSNHTHRSQSHVTDIDPSQAIDILSSERRRFTIEFLANKPPDSTVTVSNLAEHVAARENDCTMQEITSKQRERVYVALYQSHLHKMDFIEYSSDRGTITPTEAPQQLWNAYRAFQSSLDG